MSKIMRTIDATAADAIRKQLLQPFHIMDRVLPIGTAYLAEGPQMSFNNGTGAHTDLEGRFDVKNLKWSGDGVQACSIEIYNEANEASAWFMTNRISDAYVTLYLVYRRPDTSFSVPVKYAVGSCDQIELTPDSMTMNILTLNKERKFSPSQYIGSKGFNHLPPERGVVFWNNTTYVLERDFG